MAKAKTINILLGDGTLDGLVTVEDSSWEGILLIAPREKITELFLQEETKFWGVYILVSDSEVYIGQASELQKRIKQHDAKFIFWDKAILITTKDDSLNKSAIDYIEFDLIEKAKMKANLHSENKKSGNKQKVNRFEKVKLDNYIENTLLLLELLGIHVFSISKKGRKYKATHKTPLSQESKLLVDNSSIKKDKLNSPMSTYELDESLKIGKYVQSMIQQLIEKNYIFSDLQIEQLTSKEWCSENLSIHYPLLKIRTGDSNEKNDSSGRQRYYSSTYIINGTEYYLTKELFDRGKTRTKFREWFLSL